MADRLESQRPSRFDFGPAARRYDLWYQTPDGQAHDRVQKADVRRLLGEPTASEQLLDVGCGTGHWSGFFADMGYRVTGVDISTEMIEVARAAVPSGSFQVADAHRLPFKDASFDVVASMATLEFCLDAQAAIKEMVRCAKPGGTMLIGTLNGLAELNRRRLAAGQQPYASARMFEPDTLQKLLSPWGRVHMAASPVETAEGESPPRPGALHRPGGPFLVAKVDL